MVFEEILIIENDYHVYYLNQTLYF